MALTWIAERARFGWGRACLGAALLAGLVSAPAMGLAFVIGVAAVGTRWRGAESPLHRFAVPLPLRGGELRLLRVLFPPRGKRPKGPQGASGAGYDA